MLQKNNNSSLPSSSSSFDVASASAWGLDSAVSAGFDDSGER